MGEAATSVRVTSILLEAQEGGPVDASELLPLVHFPLETVVVLDGAPGSLLRRSTGCLRCVI